MDILRHGEYEGSAEVDLERGVCRGKLLFIDDLVTYEAETVGGLKEAFLEAIQDYIATCKVIGKEPLRPFRGQFNVRISPALHKMATREATRRGVSLNALVSMAMSAFLHPEVLGADESPTLPT